jgi:hypothetical protein
MPKLITPLLEGVGIREGGWEVLATSENHFVSNQIDKVAALGVITLCRLESREEV